MKAQLITSEGVLVAEAPTVNLLRCELHKQFISKLLSIYPKELINLAYLMDLVFEGMELI